MSWILVHVDFIKTMKLCNKFIQIFNIQNNSIIDRDLNCVFLSVLLKIYSINNPYKNNFKKIVLSSDWLHVSPSIQVWFRSGIFAHDVLGINFIFYLIFVVYFSLFSATMYKQSEKRNSNAVPRKIKSYTDWHIRLVDQTDFGKKSNSTILDM